MASTSQPPSRFDDPDEGVVTEAPDIGTLAVLNKSEIAQQIRTARDFPRSIKGFRNEALELVTLDERTAAECIYALPRKQKDKETGQWVLKNIEGPSARFAEIVNYAWGNTRAGARVIEESQTLVKSQGLFYDLEKNTAISYEISRNIVDSFGKRFKPDMITVTSNAASSIALRNAILKGVPKALWSPMYEAARHVVAGDIRTLANRRIDAMNAFKIFGVTPEMIYATLGVRGIEDVTIDHLVMLKGLLTAIQEGDTTAEQVFTPPTSQNQGANVRAANATQQTVSNLADLLAKPAAETGGSSATSDPPQPQETSPISQSTPGAQESAPPLKTAQEVQAELDRRRQRSAKRSEPEGLKEPSGVPLKFETRGRGRFE